MRNSISAIRCKPVGEGFDAERFYLDVEDASAFLGCTAACQRGDVHAVRLSEGAPIVQFEEYVLNCGVMSAVPGKELARLITAGHPIREHQVARYAEAGYSSAGRARQGIRSVLKKIGGLSDSDRSMVFVIGLEDAVFDELWENDASASSSQAAIGGAADNESASRELDAAIARLPGGQTRAAVLDNLSAFIGDSPAAQDVRLNIVRAAVVTDPVLIVGESGTGKEIVASKIHALSTTRNGPFVAVNCGSIALELFESEFFGAKKGAYTDAKADRTGLIGAAEGGTLFLDEIGDLRPEHQAKLLRWLENDEYTPMGCSAVETSNVRVVAATHKDLYQMVQEKSFRLDLYVRICTLKIRTPALAEYPDDACTLAKLFWSSIAGSHAQPLSESALSAIKRHPWLGNVRELKATLSGVHMYTWDDVQPESSHFERVWGQHAATPGRKVGISDACEGRRHRAECLQHLRRVDEVNWSCESVLQRALFRQSDRTAAEIESLLVHHLHEIEALLRLPLLYHRKSPFDAVRKLSDQLTRLRTLVSDDLAQARSFWTEDVEPIFDLVRGSLFSEVELLEAG